MKKPTQKALRGIAKLAAAKQREIAHNYLAKDEHRLLWNLFRVAETSPTTIGPLMWAVAHFAYSTSLVSDLEDRCQRRKYAKQAKDDILAEAYEDIKRAKARRKAGRLF